MAGPRTFATRGCALLRARTAGACLLMLFAGFVAVGCGNSAKAQRGIVVHITVTRDPSAVGTTILNECNRRAKGRYRIEEVVGPPTVDGQREQMIRRLAGADDGLDVLALDVVWTGEFSAAGWILDLTDRLEPELDTLVPATIGTIRYDDKLWAVPQVTGIASLYYRTDIVKQPPKTWEELVRQAKAAQEQHPGMSGFVWQGNQYEGLTVNAMEYLVGAGATVLDEDGASKVADDAAGEHALSFMRELISSGVSPKAVTTFQEEESRHVFEDGGAVFMRNWPYAYNLASAKGSKVRGKFAVAPLPGFEQGTPASVLGGRNLAISRFSRHPEESWDAIRCYTSPWALKKIAIVRGELPATAALWADEDIRAAVPHIDAIAEGMKTAIPRPISPYYNDVSAAINRNVHEALTGRTSPKDAIAHTDRAVGLAAGGDGEI